MHVGGFEEPHHLSLKVTLMRPVRSGRLRRTARPLRRISSTRLGRIAMNRIVMSAAASALFTCIAVVSAGAQTAQVLLGAAAGTARAEPRLLMAQAEVQIPSDAQIDRMEREAITTPPLYDGGGGKQAGESAAIRRMDERAHRIDEKLLDGGGVCGGC